MSGEPVKDPVEILSRERMRGEAAGEASKLLKSVGAKLTPDTLQYVGSIAVHYAFNKLSGQYIMVNQSCGLDKIPEKLCIHSISELGRKVMQDYGHKVPSRRYDVKEVDIA